MTENSIAIRSIQHYLYCPHRWGLMEIGNAWAENYYVTKANLLHKRVHDPECQYARKNRRIYTGIKIYNDLPEYNIFGVADCIEADADIEEVSLRGGQAKTSLCIVEYKPTHPKDEEYNSAEMSPTSDGGYLIEQTGGEHIPCFVETLSKEKNATHFSDSRRYNFEDLMQVFAQKICVDFIFGGDCDTVIYYADIKKRVYLPCRENYAEYEKVLVQTLADMRKSLQTGKIPPIKAKQKCRGCSMRDICMPGLKVKGNVRTIIREGMI